MKNMINVLIIGVLTSGIASASEYKAFTRDLVQPYNYFKQSLMLTSKKDDADKAKAALASFADSWEKFATVYANDPPVQLSTISDFSTRIKRPVAVARLASDYLKAGNIGRAHTVLEEVRYLMWDMRVRAGIVSLSDKANDFHEAMEVIFDHADSAKEPEDVQRVYERYAPWFLIKWDEMALASDLAAVNKEFDSAFKEGRSVIISYLDALKRGDSAEAKKISGGVKGAYKKIWMLNNI